MLSLISGCSEPSSIHEKLLYASVSPAPAVQQRGDSELVLVDSIGSANGDLAFGRLVSAAVSNNVIAVADEHRCAVGVIDTARAVEWWGRCGSGPGEYKSIGPIALFGDTVIVADHHLQRLTFLSLETGEGRSIDVDLRTTGGAMIWQIEMVNDTTLLASVAPLAPAAWRSRHLSEADRHLLALLDARTGLVRRQLVSDPPIAMSETPRLIRGVPMCYDSATGLAAILNDWVFQGVALRIPLDTPVINFTSTVPWYVPYRDKNGSLIPPGARIGVACADSVFLFKANHLKRDPKGPARSVGAYVEARLANGQPLLQQEIIDSESPILGSLMAAHGDRFVFYRVGTDGVPRLWVYRLVR